MSHEHQIHEDLYGTYKLVSVARTVLATGEVITLSREEGFITYGKDGRMMVIMVRGERPKPGSVTETTDEQRAMLHRLMVAYAGTYKFDGKTMEHHIDISWNEVWTGTTQCRDGKKDGDRLIYTTHPEHNPLDGVMSVTTLVWEKLK